LGASGIAVKFMESREVAIEINQDYCSKCRLCYSICPFEAISLDTNTGQVGIEIEKCQVCGICASICPSSAVELVYYSYKSLIDYVKELEGTLKTKALVVMCRGSSSPSCEIPDVLKEQNLSEFIPLRVPCVGRLSPEFYLKVLTIGINKIIAIQCAEDFCRYKRGSQVNTRRLLALQVLLEQLGYGRDVLKIVKNPLMAVYDTEKCVGCDKCEFICPYDAIEVQSLGTPEITEACKGCGACAVVCPHLAIQINGFEYETSSQMIQHYGTVMKERKARGISPVILVFCCQWAEFSALDDLKRNSLRENVLIIEIPCLTKLDPTQVLQALRLGFDGVLAFGCSKEECKLKEGRIIAEQNISVLELILDRLNLAHRFEVYEGSPRYVGDFDSKLKSFIAKYPL